jgi:hypothetical protein
MAVVSIPKSKLRHAFNEDRLTPLIDLLTTLAFTVLHSSLPSRDGVQERNTNKTMTIYLGRRRKRSCPKEKDDRQARMPRMIEADMEMPVRLA